MLVSNFANRLKEAMVIKNIKASEIVYKSKLLYEDNKINKPLTKPLISHYLKGTYEAKQDNVYTLSLILDVDEGWLMGYDIPMEKEIKQDSNAFPTADVPQKYPVLEKIIAGFPILAVENIEGYMYAPSSKIQAGYDYFFLKVIGDSMNLKFPAGCLLLVQKQPELENGQIGVIMVNGDDATVKRFKREGDLVILEPMSSNPEHQVQIYNPKKIKVEIIGKVICAITDVN